MKKITSLILVAMMLLAMLPMCFMTAAAALPTETFGGMTFETVTIYDAGDPVAALESGGWNHTTDAAGSQLAASGKNPGDAVGVLIDVKWDALASGKTEALLKFKINGVLNSGDTGGYYISKDGTQSGFFNDENWMKIAESAFDGTVFLPTALYKDGFSNVTAENVKNVSVALSATDGGTWDNVRLAFGSFTTPDYTQIPGSPLMLPDVEKLYEATSPLFVEGTSVNPVDNAGNWGSFRPDTVNGAIIADPYGVMFTIDATSAAADAVLGVTFSLNVKFKNAAGETVKTYLSPTPYGASIHGGSYTNAPLQGQCSTWYVSYDGKTWESFDIERTLNDDGSTKTGGRYAELAVGGKTAVVYVPMSEFYTKDGVYYLENNTHPTNEAGQTVKEDCVDFATFESIAGKGYSLEATTVRFDWGGTLGNKNDSANQSVVVSNFQLVSCAHDWTMGELKSAPTHTEYGWQEGHCEKCNIDSTVRLAKTPEHDAWDVVSDGPDTHTATCACGAKQDPVEHTWGEENIVLEPTHTTVGASRKVCTECGQTSNVELPTTPDHNYTYTKLDDYQHNKSCACGSNLNEDHTWDDGVVTTEATVEAEGVKTFTCSGCGATKTEAIAKLPAPAADDAKKDDDGGCGSVIGSGFAMMAILSGAAVVLTKKRRK